MKRRDFSQGAAVMALAAGAGWMPAVSWAQGAGSWNKSAFETKSLADAVKAMGGSAAAAQSADVQLTAPEIAENGNIVRMTIATTNPAVTQIALLVEKNPFILSAVFDVIPGTEANFVVPVKMGQSSNVIALAKAGDKFLYASKEVKVTLGGCGG